MLLLTRQDLLTPWNFPPSREFSQVPPPAVTFRPENASTLSEISPKIEVLWRLLVYLQLIMTKSLALLSGTS